MITDANIREYLLGRLDSDSELVESIDGQILTDPKFSITVDVIEDDIIEDYLEGSLNSEDMRAAERHFLRPPERQRRLKTARLFNRYVQAESRKMQAMQSPSSRKLFGPFRSGPVLISLRTCAEIVASVLFVALILGLLNQRREFRMAVQQANQTLIREQERSMVANQQLQNALRQLQPAIAMLSLVTPGLQRGESALPEAKISSGTRTLHVEVALLSQRSGKYRAELRHTGKTVWFRDGVEAMSVPGGAILKLDIPADVLLKGTGELAIVPSGSSAISYWFSITQSQ